jgi:succinate dehydrogenase (ubiquinone) cytochrome b560 subunit
MTISPHVTIYKFPLTAISSITNRLTGLVLSSVYVATGTACLVGLEDKLPDKRVCIFPFVYHTLGSVRHFLWDKYPKLLTNSSVHKSSIGLFTGSIITTAVLFHISEEKKGCERSEHDKDTN